MNWPSIGTSWCTQILLDPVQELESWIGTCCFEWFLKNCFYPNKIYSTLKVFLHVDLELAIYCYNSWRHNRLLCNVGPLIYDTYNVEVSFYLKFLIAAFNLSRLVFPSIKRRQLCPTSIYLINLSSFLYPLYDKLK